MRFDKCISWGKEAALGNDQFENKQACFSISLMTLVKVMDEYINANLLWGCLLVLFVGLAVYCWNKLHQKVILLSLGLFCLSCLIGLFWPVNTTYDGVNKGALILWSAFFAITSVLVSNWYLDEIKIGCCTLHYVQQPICITNLV